MQEPNSSARGSDRGLCDARVMYGVAQFACRRHRPGCGLGNIKVREQTAECHLVQRSSIALEAPQGDRDPRHQLLLYLREKKALLVRWKEHVETATVQQLEDKCEIGCRIPQGRTTMELGDETRKPCNTMRIGIADFDLITLEPEHSDGLAC